MSVGQSHPPCGPVRLLGVAGLLLLIATSAEAEFVDATAEVGIFGSQPTWGAQMADMDGDGDLDVMNAHHYHSAFIFTNLGDGHFTFWGIEQLSTGLADRHGWLWCDLDGDAIVDAVCSHGGGGGCGCSDDGNELFHGTGGGSFDLIEGAGGMADTTGRGRAFSGADIDGDGDLDLWHGKAPLAASPNSLYRNDGALTFTDVAADWGVDEHHGTVGILFADWDDDGDPDALAAGEEFTRPTTLFRNDGGVYTDVTAALAGPLPIAAGADWGDLDGDEDLDLVLVRGHEGVWDTWAVDGTLYWFFAHHRFSDNGVDVFEFDTPGEDPVAQFRWRAAIQNDRVYLGPSGEHPTTSSVVLTDAYVGAPSFTPGVSQGIFCWRESPGGRWIVHVSAPPEMFGNYSGKINTVAGVTNPTAADLEFLVLQPAMPQVYRNDGGAFVEITSELGFRVSGNPRHVTFVDFDNDGDLDLHQVNRGTSSTGNELDKLWRNDDGSFRELVGPEWAPGFDRHLSDGAVWGDTDQDGDLDVMVQEGNGALFFTTGTPGLFYRNDGVNGHWLIVQLDSASGGATPVGTKVTAWIEGRAIHRRLFANCWRGFQTTPELHFGLGQAVSIDSLVVTWPSGNVQSLSIPEVDRYVRFSEDTGPVAVPTPARASLWVGPVVPQPARGAQSIDLAIPAGVSLRVTVYDVGGRRVRELARFAGRPLETRVTWDGRDDRGQPVPAGVYFLAGEGDRTFVRRAVRLR